MPSHTRAEARRFPFSCDARLKLCAALLGLLCVLSAARPTAPLWIAACAIGSLLALRVPLKRVFHSLSGGLFTALMAMLLRVLLTRDAPQHAFELFGLHVLVSEPGLHAAALIGARVLGAVSVATWLTATTPWLDLERALAWLRVPPAVLEILSLTRRYVSVLRESMQTARSAQTLRLGYQGTRRSLRSSGVLAGLTLARALDQSIATGQAMLLRGVHAEPAREAVHPESQGNRRLAALSCAVLGASLILSRGLPW